MRVEDTGRMGKYWDGGRIGGDINEVKEAGYEEEDGRIDGGICKKSCRDEEVRQVARRGGLARRRLRRHIKEEEDKEECFVNCAEFPL